MRLREFLAFRVDLSKQAKRLWPLYGWRLGEFWEALAELELGWIATHQKC